MSGGAEIIAGLAVGVAELVKYGAYAAFQAGKLVVKGATGLVKVSIKGAKALAAALAEQQKRLSEEAERRRIEREKKREDERLEALGNQKSIAEERIAAIIRDSNKSADMIVKIVAEAQSEADEVIGIYKDIASGSGFDCTSAENLIADIFNRIAAVKSRIEDDDTAEKLNETKESIKSAGESKEVRERMNSLHDNSELVATLQVELASARMKCAALKKAALALRDLKRDLADLSVELSASNVAALAKIQALVESTDVTDYNGIMQAYRSVNELISEIKRTADAEQNARLVAFLNKRLAVIQDRLDSISGEHVTQSQEEGGEEFGELLAKAEEHYSVLSDGRLKYKSGMIGEKIRAARKYARAKNDLRSLRQTVKFLESEAETYEYLCEEYEKYIALKAECDELAVALGLKEESDNFSMDRNVLANEIARLEKLKREYSEGLAKHRRDMLLARSAVAFASDDYEFLGEYAENDENGTVKVLYARKGEVGAIHVIQADLNGYVKTYTTGVSIKADGLELTTVGSEHVKTACAKMRENHLRSTKEFDEMLGVDFAMTRVLDIPPDSPMAAIEFPSESLEGKLLGEYLKAVGATVCKKNGKLELVDINSDGSGEGEVIYGSGAENRSKAAEAARPGALHADINKK